MDRQGLKSDSDNVRRVPYEVLQSSPPSDPTNLARLALIAGALGDEKTFTAISAKLEASGFRHPGFDRAIRAILSAS